MKLILTAVVTCEATQCDERATLATDPESVTLREFGSEAVIHFRKLGWVCCRPGNGPHNLCPRHAIKP